MRTWLELPDGKTPSRDCIRTFFGKVEPGAFQACFHEWFQPVATDEKLKEDLKVLAIDGKTLRHSFDTAKEQRPLHIVSAWAAEHHISVGQVATAVRQHRSIENNCHWHLDVLFREDDSRVRERTLANNLSWLRRVAVRLLKRYPCKDSSREHHGMTMCSRTSCVFIDQSPRPLCPIDPRCAELQLATFDAARNWVYRPFWPP